MALAGIYYYDLCVCTLWAQLANHLSVYVTKIRVGESLETDTNRMGMRLM